MSGHRRKPRWSIARPTGAVTKLEQARWWAVRPAQNRKPATYRCPICNERLASMSEHMLLIPEGDASRRRHAHTTCVLRARAAGRLRLQDEWRATQRPPAGRLRATAIWHRLVGGRGGRDGAEGR